MAGADISFVGRCRECGAALAAGAAWCGQCFARVDAAASMPTGLPPSGFQPSGAQPRQVLTRRTRWQKTPTTFGPAGRLLATVGVLIPLVVMVVGGFVDMFAWGGAAVYAAVIVPWAMRDIWREGRVPVA
jgi:hypothetical protein